MNNSLDLFRLDERVAIVTGGSKGLGKAMAAALAGAGARVVVVSRHLDEAQAAAGEIQAASGRDCHAVCADVSNTANAERVVEETLARCGRIDILVNNAGINLRGPIEEIEADDMRHVWETNLLGPWLMCRAVARPMKARGWGRVINIGSLMSVVGLGDRTPYATSKGALAALTRTLALEWATSGITVNTVSPGPFVTEMNMAIYDDPARYQWFASRVPMGRWGKPDELAGVVVFFASEASSFVTGAMLMVDGGWTAQ
ncbi:MAG: glucose 1-dehydrogenase [Chloroflexi bacterium]|nr:glucose 1-dehydrogenase [Chloroflexota bacterium]